MNICRMIFFISALLSLTGCYEIEQSVHQEEIQQTIDCLDLQQSRIRVSENLVNSIEFLESNEDDSSKVQMVLEAIELINDEQDRITICTAEISNFVRLEMWEHGVDDYEIRLNGIKYMFEALLFNGRFIATEESLIIIREQAVDLKKT